MYSFGMSGHFIGRGSWIPSPTVSGARPLVFTFSPSDFGDVGFGPDAPFVGGDGRLDPVPAWWRGCGVSLFDCVVVSMVCDRGVDSVEGAGPFDRGVLLPSSEFSALSAGLREFVLGWRGVRRVALVVELVEALGGNGYDGLLHVVCDLGWCVRSFAVVLEGGCLVVKGWSAYVGRRVWECPVRVPGWECRFDELDGVLPRRGSFTDGGEYVRVVCLSWLILCVFRGCMIGCGWVGIVSIGIGVVSGVGLRRLWWWLSLLGVFLCCFRVSGWSGGRFCWVL